MSRHFVAGTVIAATVAVAACTSPIVHVWQVPGNDREVHVPTADWPEVPPSFVLSLAHGAIPQAVEALGETSWVALTPEQVATLAEVAPCPGSSLLQPFLVRGVAHGGVAAYTIVRLDPSTGWLLVSHATYNGESLLTASAVREVLPLPVIVFLAVPPKQVLSTAEVGGDWLFYGGRLQRAGRHECAA